MKKLRYPAESQLTPDIMTGSYLAIYWVLKGYHDEWNQQSVERVLTLHETGRMFNERAHIHTALYEHTWAHRPDERGTPAEPPSTADYDGIVVTVGELAEGRTGGRGRDVVPGRMGAAGVHGAVGPGSRSCPAPAAAARGLAGEAADARPSRPGVHVDPLPAPRSGGGMGRRVGQVRRAARGFGIATHLWTAPFIQTVFGTDAYTDQLW